MSSPSPERLTELAQLLAGGEVGDALDRLARIERLMREPGFYVTVVGVALEPEQYTVGARGEWVSAPTAWEATCKLADALENRDG